MKLYDFNQTSQEEYLYDFLDVLIDNELPLNEKIENFINNYERIKLTQSGVEKLIELLLRKFDISISIPRKGDNNLRYDGLLEFPDDQKVGVVEIEVPSTAMLDAPRNLLDSIAVLVQRRGYIMENIIPIVFCWSFPNNRTDYWNVVYDVRKVLEIKIRTISILTLAVYYWLEKEIDFNTMFFLDSENNIEKNTLDLLIKQGISEKNILGFFSPIK